MTGNGIEELRDAMDYILTDRAATDLLQFTAKDKIDVVTFQNIVGDIWSTDDGTKTQDMLNLIKEKRPVGSTALYDAAIKALEILSTEDTNVYNTSVILMTDGQANVGVFYDLRKAYNRINKDIPIYSITFGDADESQLEEIAELTNAKVFDGREDLVEAFKEVRGYN